MSRIRWRGENALFAYDTATHVVTKTDNSGGFIQAWNPGDVGYRKKKKRAIHVQEEKLKKAEDKEKVISLTRYAPRHSFSRAGQPTNTVAAENASDALLGEIEF